MFDDTVQNPYDRVTEKDLCSSQAQKVCLELTKKSIVLLKNEDNRLPLSETLHKDPVLVGRFVMPGIRTGTVVSHIIRVTLKEGLEKAFEYENSLCG